MVTDVAGARKRLIAGSDFTSLPQNQLQQDAQTTPVQLGDPRILKKRRTLQIERERDNLGQYESKYSLSVKIGLLNWKESICATPGKRSSWKHDGDHCFSKHVYTVESKQCRVDGYFGSDSGEIGRAHV